MTLVEVPVDMLRSLLRMVDTVATSEPRDALAIETCRVALSNALNANAEYKIVQSPDGKRHFYSVERKMVGKQKYAVVVPLIGPLRALGSIPLEAALLAKPGDRFYNGSYFEIVQVSSKDADPFYVGAVPFEEESDSIPEWVGVRG